MNTKTLFHMVALAFVGACIAACSGSEDVANEITPQQPSARKVLLTGTLSVKGDGTRAVDAEGHTYWSAGERVYIYYRNTTGGWNEVETSLVGTDIAGNATFSVEVENPQNGGDIKVVYPASCALKNTGVQGFSTTKLLTDQLGTISDISTYWDIAMGQSTMNVSGSTATITYENVIPMINQLCICKFTLKNADYTEDLNATKLEINDGTNNYTITPASATNEFYVAMLPSENADFVFVATTVGTDTYRKAFDKETLLQSNFYTSTLNMMEQGEAVDLGLSVKWADRNIGAQAPTDYGQFFAWGETQGYSSKIGNDGYADDGLTNVLDWGFWVGSQLYPIYKWANGRDYNLIKYCTDGHDGIVDNLTTLETKDDAAVANWGNGWRMPTPAEGQELWDYCNLEEVTINGVQCMKMTSKINGNYLIFPYAGSRGRNNIGRGGYQTWTNSISPSWSPGACLIGNGSGGNARCTGFPVRAVHD